MGYKSLLLKLIQRLVDLCFLSMPEETHRRVERFCEVVPGHFLIGEKPEDSVCQRHSFLHIGYK